MWLAEFLLPLQGQQQPKHSILVGELVVISWIFTTFTGSTTTQRNYTFLAQLLWLAEFLLPLQGQQQRGSEACIAISVVISWIFTTFTGSTTTIENNKYCKLSLWLAEFLLPLQGQQQPEIAKNKSDIVVISWIFTTFTGSTTTSEISTRWTIQLWLAEFLLPLQGQQQRKGNY